MYVSFILQLVSQKTKFHEFTTVTVFENFHLSWYYFCISNMQNAVKNHIMMRERERERERVSHAVWNIDMSLFLDLENICMNLIKLMISNAICLQQCLLIHNRFYMILTFDLYSASPSRWYPPGPVPSPWEPWGGGDRTGH